MPTTAAYRAEVDEALQNWQQGDVILGDVLGFVHIADLSRPLTDVAHAQAELGFEEGGQLTALGSSVDGLAIITQTCDVIKPCETFAFVQVAALRRVEKKLASEVRHCLRPNLAMLPGVFEQDMVVDLEKIMTIEKSVLIQIPHERKIRGLGTDEEVRAFAECLSRRFSRFAFPDDFVEAVSAIRDRLISKHGKSTEEGNAYATLREIRVVVSPAWDDGNPNIEFLFVQSEVRAVTDVLERAIEDLMARFKPTGPFREVHHRIVSLMSMTAALYLASDPLDLDHLSRSRQPPV